MNKQLTRLNWYLLAALLLAGLLLSACGGTLEIAFDSTPTPDLGPASTVAVLETQVATLGPSFRPLDLNSGSEEIRQAMLNSHQSWQTLWADGTIVTYNPEGAPRFERVQIWVDRINARFRVLTGPMEAQPYTVQVSDGASQARINLSDGSTTTQTLMDASRNLGWQAPQVISDTIEPHPLDLEIDSPASDTVFPAALAQRSGTLTPTGMERVAGRPALLAEWSNEYGGRDRFWIDTRTGVVLGWQSFQKGLDAPATSVSFSRVEYDLAFSPDLFNLQLAERPMFANDAAGGPVPTLIPPQTGYEPGAGELYFVINRSPESARMVRLPGNCITGGDPCPLPEVIEGYPNQNGPIEPLIWSPDGSQAVMVMAGQIIRYNALSGEWLALAQFPIVLAPAWSLDGQWIAFVGQDGSERQDVYIVHPDGSDLRSLTGGVDNTGLWVGGWLNDGRLLVNVFNQLAGSIYTLHPDREGLEPFTSAELRYNVIDVSRSGTQVAFSTQEANTTILWVADVGGGEPRRIATFQQAGMQQVAWSPDGQWIAFLLSSGMVEQYTVSTVYVVRANGTDMRQLFQDTIVRRIVFSPDGQSLVTEGTENGRLYVVPLEGTSRLVEAPGLLLNQPLMGVSFR